MKSPSRSTRSAKLIIIAPAAAQVIDEGGALFSKRAVYGQGTAEDANGR